MNLQEMNDIPLLINNDFHLCIEDLLEQSDYDGRNYFENPQAGFLNLIGGPINFIVNRVLSHLKIHPIKINEESIKLSIIRDIHELWFAKLVRCCILEFNEAIRSKLISGATMPDKLNNFVDELSNGQNKIDFFNKYCVLKKHIEQFIRVYPRNLIEIIDRYHNDHDAIYTNNLLRHELSIFHGFKFTGDPHNEVRRVCILKFIFNNQCEFIVYKPRSVVNELAYLNFLNYFNNFLKHKNTAALALTKSNYGWCQYISFNQCASNEDLERFYYRYGSLIAICSLLNISDLHHENLIANGEFPVIVDLECMALPMRERQEGLLSTLDTPAASGLLPSFIFGDHGCKDVSAYSGGTESLSIFDNKLISFSENGLVIKEGRSTEFQEQNIPQMNGIPIEPLHYRDHVSKGYSDAYIAICENILDIKRFIVKNFQHVNSRLIVRHTSDYMSLMYESYHPRLLYDNEQFRTHFEWLHKNKKIDNIFSTLEYKQMISGDIPYFYVPFNSKRVKTCLNKNVEFSVHQSGRERIIQSIEKISQNDLRSNLLFIDKSLDAITLNSNRKISSSSESSNTERTDSVMRASISAKKILNNLLSYCENSTRIRLPQHLTVEKGDKIYYKNSIVTNDLYQGLTGILLTYAYASVIYQSDRYHHFVMKGIAQIAQFLMSMTDLAKNRKQNWGLFNGLSGILHLLSVLENLRFTDIPHSVSEQILHLADISLSEYIDTTSHFDYMNGLAGLGVALNQLSSTYHPLSKYKNDCVEAILSRYSEPSILPIESKTDTIQQSLLGLSHGVSGVASVLAQLSHPNQNKNVHTWIKKALSYERENFSLKFQEWPKYINGIHGFDHQKFHQASWCHGSIGIGFTRLSLLSSGYSDPFIDYEVAISLEKAKNLINDKQLNLCHGVLGIHDLFLIAESTTIKVARFKNELTENILLECENSDNILTEHNRKVFMPGLMTGLSGVAYQLMRIINPELVPSILLINNSHSLL